MSIAFVELGKCCVVKGERRVSGRGKLREGRREETATKKKRGIVCSSSSNTGEGTILYCIVYCIRLRLRFDSYSYSLGLGGSRDEYGWYTIAI